MDVYQVCSSKCFHVCYFSIHEMSVQTKIIKLFNSLTLMLSTGHWFEQLVWVKTIFTGKWRVERGVAETCCKGNYFRFSEWENETGVDRESGREIEVKCQIMNSVCETEWRLFRWLYRNWDGKWENDVETGEDRERCWEIEVRLNFKKECKEMGSERIFFIMIYKEKASCYT